MRLFEAMMVGVYPIRKQMPGVYIYGGATKTPPTTLISPKSGSDNYTCPIPVTILRNVFEDTVIDQ